MLPRTTSAAAGALPFGDGGKAMDDSELGCATKLWKAAKDVGASDGESTKQCVMMGVVGVRKNAEY
jgi:hypothetical protein